jgi:hypothetical protein
VGAIVTAYAAATTASDPVSDAGFSYSKCVGLNGATRESSGAAIDDAVKFAFDSCKVERKRAVSAIVDALKAKGKAESDATKIAEEIVAESDQNVARQLGDALRLHRNQSQTGSNAPNQ